MYDNLVKRLRYRAKREDDYYEHGGDMINEAADAIEALNDTSQAQDKALKNIAGQLARRWIPVTERLPEKKKAHYLCYLDDDSVGVCYWSNISIHGSKWEWHNPNWKEVTHWMPLPEPPKEEN